MTRTLQLHYRRTLEIRTISNHILKEKFHGYSMTDGNVRQLELLALLAPGAYLSRLELKRATK